MAAIPAEIHYPLPGKPADGALLEIAPGVHWLRMPLPFVLNHINLWILDDGDGWCVVDTGISADSTRAAWTALFAGPLAGRPVTRVICTHLHPDHVGLAGWLCARFDAPLAMTRGEYLSARMLAADAPPPPQVAIDFYRAAGLSDAQLGTYRARFGRYGRLLSPLPQAYRRLEDGARLSIGGRSFEVLVERGHSPEHACLWCAELKLLVAGDQVLPTISPNVSVWPTEPAADPLGEWLASCRRLPGRVAPDALVLPAHGRPFVGVGERLAALVAEHEAGLAAILDHAARPCRAIDLFGVLFRAEIDAGNLVMASGEAVAHLNYLVARGRLEWERDADGVDWYRRR